MLSVIMPAQMIKEINAAAHEVLKRVKILLKHTENGYNVRLI